MSDSKSPQATLQNCVAVQTSDGNWNVEPYQLGYANGMLLGLGIIKGEEPVFLNVPAKGWLSPRARAYAAIDTERTYQDQQRGNAKRHANMPPKMTPGECILTMEKCLNDARVAWYSPEGGTACLEHLRKVAAVAVQAMENYGAPKRV